MANYYVYSGAAGAGTGANWANAYTTLGSGIAAAVSGDSIYVAHDHNESTGGGLTWVFSSNLLNTVRVLCVNRAGSVPPISGDLRTTGIVTAESIQIVSSCYVYGLTLVSTASILITGSVGAVQVFSHCLFKLDAAAIALHVNSITTQSCTTVFDQTQVQFGHVSQKIIVKAGTFRWKDTQSSPAVLGTAPSQLLVGDTVSGYILLEGLDLSALGSGKTLIPGDGNGHQFFVKDCRVGSGVTLAGNSPEPSTIMDFIRVDSGTTNYRSERYLYSGTLTTETTIVRSDGATDGATPIAWKIVTSSNARGQSPFEAFPIAIWNETTGSPITVTIEGIWDGGAVPLNDEIWIDIEYLGDASYSQGSFVTTTKADILATGTSVASSSETWGGSTTAFKLATSVTPQMKGPITAYTKAAKPSSTFYVDPKITLS